MCNRYISPEEGDIERHFNLPRRYEWRLTEIFPRAMGPFVRAAADQSPRELVIGQWGLIPWFATSAKLTYSTNNARFEELTEKASYKEPWARGQRCIIPAVSFDEPCWESGRNVWWRFRRADGQLWGLAGIWNAWREKSTGQLHESYSMLTINADQHPLMGRMHKPDPKYGPTEQDKRSVIPIELGDVDQWLHGTAEEANALVRLPAVEIIAYEELLGAAKLKGD